MCEDWLQFYGEKKQTAILCFSFQLFWEWLFCLPGPIKWMRLVLVLKFQGYKTARLQIAVRPCQLWLDMNKTKR